MLIYFWIFNVDILFKFSNSYDFKSSFANIENKNMILFYILLFLLNAFIPAVIQLLRYEIEFVDDLEINFSSSIAVLCIGILFYGYKFEVNPFMEGIYSISLYVCVIVLMQFYTFFAKRYKYDYDSGKIYCIIPIVLYIISFIFASKP